MISTGGKPDITIGEIESWEQFKCAILLVVYGANCVHFSTPIQGYIDGTFLNALLKF